MTSNRFSIRKNDLRSSTVRLSRAEHHHLSRVARIKLNEKVWLFDEDGTNYLARVDEIGKHETRLVIVEKRAKHEPRVRIILAQALLKSNKMENLIQKSTELGVAAIIPVTSARTIVRIGDRAVKKVERWQGIAREAAKQDPLCFAPLILPPINLKDLARDRNEDRKLLLSERKEKYLKEILLEPKTSRELPSSLQILIGPEGGWTEQEEELILRSSYEAVSLGRRILRAETATISCLAMVSHFWNS